MERETYFQHRACNGSGIYRGSMEPEGIGVICLECDDNNGSGKAPSRLTSNGLPFVCLTPRNDVRLVYRRIGDRRGEYIGTPVTSAEFFNGSRPQGEAITNVLEVKK